MTQESEYGENKMKNKIYNYNTHSLTRSNNHESVYLLTINFLELLFDYNTNELIDIYGFFPLVNAIKCNIDLGLDIKMYLVFIRLIFYICFIILIMYIKVLKNIYYSLLIIKIKKMYYNKVYLL